MFTQHELLFFDAVGSVLSKILLSSDAGGNWRTLKLMEQEILLAIHVEEKDETG